MSDWWANIRYFKSSEFDSQGEPNSGKNMRRDLIEILDAIRGRIGRALKITSGYRTREDNERVGGVLNSAHTRGLAVDVQTSDSSLRYALIEQALKCGIRRVGIGKDFIHLDLDPDLPQKTCWLYAKNS